MLSRNSRLNHRALALVRHRATAAGLHVDACNTRFGGSVLAINGRTVLVRGATVTMRKHLFRVRGHVYKYNYAAALWNLNVAHGAARDRDPDAWALVLYGRGGALLYVVPGKRLAGKLTLQVLARRLGRRDLSGHWLEQYAHCWDVLVPRARRAVRMPGSLPWTSTGSRSRAPALSAWLTRGPRMTVPVCGC